MLIPTLLLLIVAGLVLAAGVFYTYWWRIQRPVPTLAGRVEVAGLQDPVEVVRDRHGIPHLYAENDEDLFRALGFVHAQDRLWQMEQKRRTAHGRLAEVFGVAALDADRFCRIAGIGRAARDEVAQLGAAERRVLDAYAGGVNEYVRQNPGRVAAEFNLLHLKPEPWSALDTLACMKLMAWQGSANWETELLRLVTAARLGHGRAVELGSIVVPAADILGNHATATSVQGQAETARRILETYESIRPWLGPGSQAGGSNSWAIAPRLSATGRAVLANDTHMGVQIPTQWYEAHLSSPSYKVCGATIPGIPGVWAGHNETIAWGMTNALCDVQDLYLERSSPDNPVRYLYEDEWYDVECIDERIGVREREVDHVERVLITRNGPVIDAVVGKELQATSPQVSLSLRWTGIEPGQTTRALLALNRADGWDAFRTALAEWQAPPLRFTYADASGNIGCCFAGHVPMREAGRGLFPSAGWDGNSAWSDYLPFDELPHTYNPASGIIVAANERPESARYLGADFDPGWRAARIQENLLEKDRHTLRDLAEMQMDTASGFARKLAPWFGRLEPTDSYESVACGLLRKWDYRMAPDSPAVTVFQYAWRALLALTLGQRLGEAQQAFYGASAAPVFADRGFDVRCASALAELIAQHEESFWYGDAEKGGHRSRQAVLELALTEAVRRLRKDLGDNARRWEWGRLHQVRYTHPLGGGRALRPFFNRGPFPVGGDSTTLLQTGELPQLPPSLVQIAPNYRQVIDAGNWDQVQSVLATGQSGHPLSPHYADQVDLWREGAYHTTQWSRNAVDEAAVYRMALVSPDAVQ